MVRSSASLRLTERLSLAKDRSVDRRLGIRWPPPEVMNLPVSVPEDAISGLELFDLKHGDVLTPRTVSV